MEFILSGESSLHTPPLFQNVQPVESEPQDERSSGTSGSFSCLFANIKTLGCKKVLDPQGIIKKE